MNPTEAARHIRRLERKADELRDEIEKLREAIETREEPKPKGKSKNDADAEFES